MYYFLQPCISTIRSKKFQKSRNFQPRKIYLSRYWSIQTKPIFESIWHWKKRMSRKIIGKNGILFVFCYFTSSIYFFSFKKWTSKCKSCYIPIGKESKTFHSEYMPTNLNCGKPKILDFIP